jgi:hypothetical protein
MNEAAQRRMGSAQEKRVHMLVHAPTVRCAEAEQETVLARIIQIAKTRKQ